MTWKNWDLELSLTMFNIYLICIFSNIPSLKLTASLHLKMDGTGRLSRFLLGV